MPDNDVERELGPAVTGAFHDKAADAGEAYGRGLAREAQKRIHRRRQSLLVASAAVVVAAAIGGVWGLTGMESPISTTAQDSAGSAESGTAGKAAPGRVAADGPCPAQHPIAGDQGQAALPPGTGLDLQQPVRGLQVCRYQLSGTGTTLLATVSYDAVRAQQVVDTIKGLPERNPDLPAFKCAPDVAQAREAIVLRFATASGIREIWLHYDGCTVVGFTNGTRTYGLYAAPLKLILQGPVRPTGGTYLDHLSGW